MKSWQRIAEAIRQASTHKKAVLVDLNGWQPASAPTFIRPYLRHEGSIHMHVCGKNRVILWLTPKPKAKRSRRQRAGLLIAYALLGGLLVA
jgi:hypothetical protein